MGLPACKYEFGQRILARVAKPESKLEPRLQAAVFLGFAPNVTNGFYVMRSDGVIELTSNITEDPVFGEQQPVLGDGIQPRQAGPEPKPPAEKTPEEMMLEAVMGFEGGGGPFWDKDVEEWNIYDHIPPDDPFATQSVMKNIAKAMKTKFDDKIWETDEVRPEETPE